MGSLPYSLWANYLVIDLSLVSNYIVFSPANFE